MSWVIFKDAQPAVEEFGLNFCGAKSGMSGKRSLVHCLSSMEHLVSSAIALFLAVPTGLAVAIVTSEDFLPAWVRSPLGFLVELIAVFLA
jgi:phosphate transport system permease protein